MPTCSRVSLSWRIRSIGCCSECQPFVKRFETVPTVKNERGFYYPDPNDMAEYIANLNNDLYRG